MDTCGESNSNFGAIEDEERRLAAAENQIGDPDGPPVDLTFQGLTFLQRIYDTPEDQINFKMNATGPNQFRLHRRALKVKHKGVWPTIRVSVPTAYGRGLLCIQSNNPELYADIQEIYQSAFLLGTEMLLNAYKAENRPLSWHLNPETEETINVFKLSTAYLEKLSIFMHHCSTTMGILDGMKESSVYEESKRETIDSLWLLADQMAATDPGRYNFYRKILKEWVPKADFIALENRTRKRKERSKNEEEEQSERNEKGQFISEKYV